MVDVLPGTATGSPASEDSAAAAAATGDPTANMTRRERARYERELAVLDLTDAAQATARGPALGDDTPADRSQLDLAAALYASADRHRQLAGFLDADLADPDTGEHGR